MKIVYWILIGQMGFIIGVDLWLHDLVAVALVVIGALAGYATAKKIIRIAEAKR